MVFSKIKKTCLIFLLVLLFIPNLVLAYSDYVIPGGENIGIELKTDGVMVVGHYMVNNTYPAKEAGLKIGDLIVEVNDKKISTINNLVSEINKISLKKTVKIKFIRNDKFKTTHLNLHKDNNSNVKTGLYVKDNITGIGTLSFIDPNTKLYGALGHEIIEKTSGQLIMAKEGKIFKTSVNNIERSKVGIPGSKNAKFFTNNTFGNVLKNTNKGIFGNYTENLPNKQLYKVANPTDITLGNAKILTVLNKDEINEFNIKITKINLSNNQETKNIIFEINDNKLIETTGGIVQGMSGSPIVQNEYIIGAITNIVIDKPTKGYGIFITNMLKEAEN